MGDAVGAKHLCHHSHPLIPVIGLCVQVLIAVRSVESAVDHDVRARRANVAVRAIVGPIATEQLHLDRSGEVLIEAHAFGRLRMDHDSIISVSPIGTALYLLTDKPVLRGDQIVGKLVFVEKVAELAVESGVLVIRNLQESVLNSKRIPEIVADFVLCDLDGPSIKVLSVEQLNPVGLVRFQRGILRRGQPGQQQKDCYGHRWLASHDACLLQNGVLSAEVDIESMCRLSVQRLRAIETALHR